MYFEAESNGVKFEINVNETRTHWKVDVKEGESDWVPYKIPKDDFQSFDNTISFIFNQSSYLVDVVGEDTEYNVYARGSYRTVKIYNEEKILHESLKKGGNLTGGDGLTAGMPGKIVKVFVKPGQKVQADEPLLIMEAMKMENEMRASREAVIKEILVSEGENIEAGSQLITFET